MLPTSQKLTWSAALLVIFSVAFARMIPHPPNFTPLMASAIFSGAVLGHRNLLSALVLPLAALLLSDLALGFHPHMIFTYGSVAAITYFLGHRYLAHGSARRHPNEVSHTQSWLNVGTAALASSVLFFVVSNFGVWAVGGGVEYPRTLAGLALCYVAAVPFFWSSMAGDLFFSMMIFGGFTLLATSSLRNVSLGKNA